MAGTGRTPKEERMNPRDVPTRGDWRPAPGEGWQHGPVPKCPPGLLKASKDAWSIWMDAWFAAFWMPADLPGLRQLIHLYDQVERNPDVASLHSQLRQMMDIYGITPKGQQDRRWKRPEGTSEQAAPASGGKYAHLRPVAND